MRPYGYNVGPLPPSIAAWVDVTNGLSVEPNCLSRYLLQPVRALHAVRSRVHPSLGDAHSAQGLRHIPRQIKARSSHSSNCLLPPHAAQAIPRLQRTRQHLTPTAMDISRHSMW